MGRVKVKMKRIENNTSRLVTFSKRRNGLLKKVYELSVLCDIDIALIMFSPCGRLTHFSGKSKRTEDVLMKFLNLPEQEQQLALFPSFGQRDRISPSNFNQDMISILRSEPEISPFLPNPAGTASKTEEFNRLYEQLQMVQERISLFEPDLQKIKSMEELELCEKHLESVLASVKERKKHLMNNRLVSLNSTCLLGMLNSLENEFVSWSQNHDNMFDSSSSSSVPTGDDVSMLYDQLSTQGSSSSMGGWPAKTPSVENLSIWQPADELNHAVPTAFPSIQRDMTGPEAIMELLNLPIDNHSAIGSRVAK